MKFETYNQTISEVRRITAKFPRSLHTFPGKNLITPEVIAKIDHPKAGPIELSIGENFSSGYVIGVVFADRKFQSQAVFSSESLTELLTNPSHSSHSSQQRIAEEQDRKDKS